MFHTIVAGCNGRERGRGAVSLAHAIAVGHGREAAARRRAPQPAAAVPDHLRRPARGSRARPARRARRARARGDHSGSRRYVARARPTPRGPLRACRPARDRLAPPSPSPAHRRKRSRDAGAARRALRRRRRARSARTAARAAPYRRRRRRHRGVGDRPRRCSRAGTFDGRAPAPHRGGRRSAARVDRRRAHCGVRRVGPDARRHSHRHRARAARRAARPMCEASSSRATWCSATPPANSSSPARTSTSSSSAPAAGARSSGWRSAAQPSGSSATPRAPCSCPHARTSSSAARTRAKARRRSNNRLGAVSRRARRGRAWRPRSFDRSAGRAWPRRTRGRACGVGRRWSSSAWTRGSSAFVLADHLEEARRRRAPELEVVVVDDEVHPSAESLQAPAEELGDSTASSASPASGPRSR